MLTNICKWSTCCSLSQYLPVAVARPIVVLLLPVQAELIFCFSLSVKSKTDVASLATSGLREERRILHFKRAALFCVFLWRYLPFCLLWSLFFLDRCFSKHSKSQSGSSCLSAHYLLHKSWHCPPSSPFPPKNLTELFPKSRDFLPNEMVSCCHKRVVFTHDAHLWVFKMLIS